MSICDDCELKAEVEWLKVKNEKHKLTNEILIDEYGKLSDRLTEREGKWRELVAIMDLMVGYCSDENMNREAKLRSELMEVKDDV